jgi:hypothetical protein
LNDEQEVPPAPSAALGLNSVHCEIPLASVSAETQRFSSPCPRELRVAAGLMAVSDHETVLPAIS